ncbi:MAG: M15 family metallopeptidase [Nocardioides sp.]
MIRGGSRTTAAAMALLVAATLVSCGGEDSKTADPPRRPTSGSATTAGETSPTADPDNGVGPRRGALRGADMLVFSQNTLTDEMVEKIRDLKGVRSVERLSMAQVSIENRAINIAAVDPATYRNYTPAVSAELQEEWDRVAKGQLALVPGLKKRVPGKKQLLRLGGGRDAPQVAIGAYAPQIPQVDAVVNADVGKALGMKPGNALVVATYPLRSPQSVRGPMEKIAGKTASVQILGPDLDTSVQQTAYLVGSVASAVGIFNYTVIGGGHIAPEQSWVAEHIVTRNVPILGAVTCNRLIFPQLEAALRDVIERGLADKIHPGEYAGCYYPRFIAGTTQLSNHSFGLALDLNVPGNQRGTVGEMDRSVVQIFEAWGFTWGGTWRYTDPMHFEANRIVRPG